MHRLTCLGLSLVAWELLAAGAKVMVVRYRAFCMAIVAAFILNSWVSAQSSATQNGKQRTGAAKKTKGTVAVFTLRAPIVETPVSDDPLLGTSRPESLKDLVWRIEQARDDEQVQAAAIIYQGSPLGTAQVQELHQSLLALREKGKPVYFYSDSLSFGSLALASAASRISVAPVGDVMVLGMYGEQLFLRGLLDKLRIQPDFQTCGEYKSAGELFMRKSPSPQAAEMMDWLYDGIFDSYVRMIADGRGTTAEAVKDWLDQGLYTAEQAVKRGIIDAAEVREDFVRHIRDQHGEKIVLDTKYGQKRKTTVDFSNPFAFLKVWSEMLKASGQASDEDAVAIVYVEGPIMPGEPEPSPLGNQGTAYSDPIRKALDRVADDDSVKAVVLRVDSPGGSATASEIILRATQRVAAKKPFVVSMGNVAGSGGYYVACGTDTIFADEATITASIGVVSGKLATRGLWESMGVHWHPIARGRNSGMLASADVMTDEQRKLMKGYMDEVYGVFKGHVLKARGDRLKKPIDELAGGRVFTGKQALELGLVDRLGSLRDAIRYAAEKANLDEGDYEIRVVPPPKNFLEQLLQEMAGKEDDSEIIRLGRVPRSPWEQVWSAASPLLHQMQPQRAIAIRRALRQLEILHTESVTLMTPEYVID